VAYATNFIADSVFSFEPYREEGADPDINNLELIIREIHSREQGEKIGKINYGISPKKQK